MPSRRGGDLDSPWKEALEHFQPQFLAFFFPNIYKALDWSRNYQSLDKELHQLVRGAKVGRRLADKLFKVWQKDGQEAWLLIHVEVQAGREEHFGERMFVYNYRVYDRYRKPVVSLAVLCDAEIGWRPERFGYNMWGCEVGIRFLATKLLDYRSQQEQLEAERNPFAAVVLAQLKAIETQHAPEHRWTWKVRLVKGLYERGLAVEEIRELFRLIDWMLALPDELEDEFLQEVHRFEQERSMPYITSVERLALKKGRQEGRQEGLRDGLLEGVALDLETRFGEVDKKLLEDIRALKTVAQIRKVARALKKARSLDEIRRLTRP
jgi:hypothetical protein